MASPKASEAIAHAGQQLDRLQGFFPRAETKASFLFAVNLGLLTVLFLNLGDAKSLSAPLVWAPTLVFILLWLWSMVTLYDAFFPHIDGGEVKSLIYFGDIAQMDFKTFKSSYKSSSEADILDDFICQIWRNSEILDLKFKSVKLAFQLFLTALPFWALTLLALSVVSGHAPKVAG